ncbi:LCP family protein [Kutzneria sp. CA-103260]|uniref:LCP family protein n=1 Tax=Kutzneria sp. CA-103260 TaxID=2802641 RepID=UPI0020133E90|nr:LCP family protein [Kutzneria sp. CA-103260]
MITGRTVVALASVAVIGLSGYGWTLLQQAQTHLTTDNVIEHHTPPAAPATVPHQDGQDTNFLLVGIDSRTDVHGNPLPPDVLASLHAGPDDGFLNTDTLIVVHVPGDGGKASAISIPRDSYVDIADGDGRDYGKHKINSAYSIGMNNHNGSQTEGRKTLINTVEKFTGVTIDHYAEINLYGFDLISQALGGVPVCLNHAVDDREYSGAVFPAGQQTLSGVQALQFVRQRHGLDNGDIDRERRQQAFLASAVHQLLSVGTLTSPSKLNAIITAVQNSIVLDQDWNLLQFAQQVQGISGGNITFDTIPIVNITYWTPADGDAVQVDPAQVKAFVQAKFGDAPTPPAGATTTTPTSPTGKAAGTSTDRSPVIPSQTTGGADTSSTGQSITATGVTCVN